MFPGAIPWGTLKSRETKITHKTSAGPVIKCFVISPNSKLEKTAKKLFALHRLVHKFA